MQVLLSELKKLNKLLLTLPMLQLKDQRIFTTKLLRLPSILRIKLLKSEAMFTMLYLKDLKLQKKSLLVLHTLLLKMHHMLLRKSKRKSAKLSKSFPVLLKVLNKQSHLLLQMQRMLPLKSKIKLLIKPLKSRITLLTKLNKSKTMLELLLRMPKDQPKELPRKSLAELNKPNMKSKMLPETLRTQLKEEKLKPKSDTFETEQMI